MIEPRTAQQIEQYLLDAIAAHPGCAGARITVTVQRRPDGDSGPGTWSAEIKAARQPSDRDACELAILGILLEAEQSFSLVLDS
jgi:hypothetical protein